MNIKQWYAAWHRNPNHGFYHWGVFAVTAAMSAATLVVLQTPGSGTRTHLLAQARTYTYAESQSVYDQVYNGLISGSVNTRDLGNEGGPTSPVDPMAKQIYRESDACLSGCRNDACRAPCNATYRAKYNEIYTARNDAIADWQSLKAGQQQQQQTQQRQQQQQQEEIQRRQQANDEAQQRNDEAVRLRLQQQREEENPVLEKIPSDTVNRTPLALQVPGGLLGEVGVPFSQSFTATGGLPPYHFQLGSGIGFPPFRMILDTNGLLSGTPLAAGSATFSVVVVDTAGNSDSRTVTVVINRRNIAPLLNERNNAAVVRNVVAEATDEQGKVIPAQDLETGFGKNIHKATVTFPLVLAEGQTAVIETPHGLPLKQLTLTDHQAVTGQTTVEVLDAARGGHPLEEAGIKPPDAQQYDINYFLKIGTKVQDEEAHPFKEAIMSFGIPEVILANTTTNDFWANRVTMLRYLEDKKEWIELNTEPQPQTVRCEFSYCGYAHSPGTSFFAVVIKKPLATITDHVVSYESLSPGQIVTSVDSIPMTIEYKDGSHIYLDRDAVLLYINPTIYRLLNGRFYLILGKSLAGKKFTTPHATFVAAKTEHTDVWVNVSSESTTVQVNAFPSLFVAVSDLAKKPKTAKVTGGQQITVFAAGLGAKESFDVEKIEPWFGRIPPSHAFWDESWNNTSAASAYSAECNTTFGEATATETLTADEQAQLDAFNALAPKIHIKQVRAIDEAGKKLHALTEKASAAETLVAELYVSANKIFYPGARAGSWKQFTDPTITNSFFSSARLANLTHGLDRASFEFYLWTYNLTRVGAFAGSLTPEGTAEFIKDTIGAAAEAEQSAAVQVVVVDDETRLIKKTGTVVNIKSGKSLIPATQRCDVSYGKDARITIPARAAAVSAEVGKNELGELFQSVQ